MRAALAHKRPVRVHDQPRAAELGHVLAAHLPGASVADVVVQRPAVVRDLPPAVLALDGSDQLLADALAGDQRALLVVDGPGGGAVPVAAALAAARVARKAEAFACVPEAATAETAATARRTRTLFMPSRLADAASVTAATARIAPRRTGSRRRSLWARLRSARTVRGPRESALRRAPVRALRTIPTSPFGARG